jgi:predicted phage baseplate assembly protein
VRVYLDDRRLLTTSLDIGAPQYTPVTIQARIKARPEADPEQVQMLVAERLYRFVNPVVGGHAGEGWPFGRDLFISEVFAVLQGVAGVEYVEAARMLVTGEEGPVGRVVLEADGLLMSAEHTIIVV